MSNRLRQEQHRLYASPDAAGVRALILELAQPGAWDAAVSVWQAVQDEWQWPAPALAVSGVDAFQVWFSLDSPLSRAEARRVLERLCARFLAARGPGSVRAFLGAHEPADETERSVTAIPEQRPSTGHWSAFVLPNLGALFADEPWLDIEPGPDAQADVLLRLESVASRDVRRVLEGPRPNEARPVPDPAEEGSASSSAERGRTPMSEPRAFLLSVMNDPGVELALRIEAARALLPYDEGSGVR